MRIRALLVLGAAIGATVCLGACPGPGEPVFPLDWETAFTEVRDCRLSIEHELTYIRLFVSPEWADYYVDCVGDGMGCTQPFGDGATFLKPEYRDSACTELDRIAASRKDSMDDALDDDGWRWQVVSPTLNVRRDGALNDCIDCHRQCDGTFDHRCRIDP